VNGRARGWLAFGVGAGAVLWTLALVLAAFIVPAYSGESCQGGSDGVVTCGSLPSETLFAVNGWWVVELLLAVVLVATLGFWGLHRRCASEGRHGGTLATLCIVALGLFSIVSGFSIGLFVLPAVLFLLASAALTPERSK
jgi:energy-converting hydrogenase Eha subunit B